MTEKKFMSFPFITLEQRKKLEKTVSEDSGLNHSLILMLLYSGGTLSEVMDLETDSILYKEGFIRLPHIYRRERMMERKVPIPARVMDTLKKIHPLKTMKRPSTWKGENRIYRLKGKRTFERRAIKLLKEAGISSGLKATHNSFGVYMASEGYPLFLISIFMGYRSSIGANKFAPWLNTEKMYGRVMKSREIEENYNALLKERNGLKDTLELFIKEKIELEEKCALYENDIKQLKGEYEKYIAGVVERSIEDREKSKEKMSESDQIKLAYENSQKKQKRKKQLT